MEVGESNYSLISVRRFPMKILRILNLSFFLSKSPYDSFMRKHLQHYGYFTGMYEWEREMNDEDLHVKVEVKS